VEEAEKGVACDEHGNGGNCIDILVPKLKRGRSHGRRGCKWGNNIKTDFKEMGWKDMACVSVIPV
jgi:hypothetical protein